MKLACKISDEYGLVKGAVEEKKKNKGAVVAVSDPNAPWSGKKSNVFLQICNYGHMYSYICELLRFM